ncbi:unnamed protein product [Closterium sp. Naga37s-1]|nr:unnamed protein product [Closterium sp. Naga37s-1]
MPTGEPAPSDGARNGLSVLGVLPRLSENYAVPIAQLPTREPSPECVVGTVYPFELPDSPTAWEPHPDIELVRGGGEGSSKPPTASPSTVSTAPVKRPRPGTTYKQQTLWGAPPPRDSTSNKRPAPSADPKPPTALADAEYESVKKTFEGQWQGAFKWLRLLRMSNGRPSLKCAICVKHGDPLAHTAYGPKGEGARDLQIGSIRTHSATRAHKNAVENQEKAEAGEALAASDAAEEVPELLMIDDVVRAFADHIGRSSVDYQNFQEMQRIFCQTNLEAQGISDTRWLAHGEAIQRLLDVLPVAIVVLKDYKADLYEVVTSFKFHWLIRFLADVLWELNCLNQRFQQRQVSAFVAVFYVVASLFVHHLTPCHALVQVDVTLVAHIVQQTRMRLKTRYSLRDPSHDFGSGEKMQLPQFIHKHQAKDKREMKAEGIDGDGNPVTFEFTLHERPQPGHETDGDVQACVELSIKYARAIDKELEWRMRDLQLLEAFTPTPPLHRV